ncbi:hypothetical protein [Anaerococcus vaginimassiliensis]|uniref:hypothetical protein n=1 Tax=Anaerococcus vaginimassiliensis TaxID=2042308 RepID=UPI00103043C3|nr:hypothetical protein [Anaerococcus vaginimassiliensis]MDU5149133.1 hypothetical protein [Anaerococcus prevotii]
MIQALIALILLPVLGVGIFKFIFKLGFGLLGLILAVVCLPILLIVGILLLPLMLVGGFVGLAVKLLPVVLVGLLIYFGYRYYKENYEVW